MIRLGVWYSLYSFRDVPGLSGAVGVQIGGDIYICLVSRIVILGNFWSFSISSPCSDSWLMVRRVIILGKSWSFSMSSPCSYPNSWLRVSRVIILGQFLVVLHIKSIFLSTFVAEG